MSMHALVPLPVLLPLAMASLLAGLGNVLPRRAIDLMAILTSAVVAVVCALLARAAMSGTLVYWFGNWHPDLRDGSAVPFPVGVCFSLDPLGAGMAALVATLATAAFAFSWSYFEEVKSLFHALMLAFMAAMCGMCLSGDLFNLFVWFELMTAAAVALCGYKSEESPSLLGSLNFAVVNSVGAFISLSGVAILYAYTGTLNMALAGRSLAAHPPGATFVCIALLLLCTGFLVKMAAVPFHFWLADAHAVAPTPVCALFSGVMVELGLFAVARLYWTTFAPVVAPHADAVRDVFLAMGTLTALVGAIYAFGQRHFKRMLAFSTISHVGLMIIAFALRDADALGGLGVYVVGHGLIKGVLFLGAGMILHRCGSVDEHDLRGAGRNQWPLGVLLAIGALGLAGMPPFATFYGMAAIHDAAESMHLPWLTPVVVLAEALTAAAVLRVTARIFLGWGATREATSRGAPHVDMDRETVADHDHTPAFMWLPATILLIAALAIAIPRSARADAFAAAARFRETAALAAATLDGKTEPITVHAAPAAPFGLEHVLTLLTIALLLLLTLRPAVLGTRLNWLVSRGIVSATRPLRRVQSGHAGDYIAWLAFGLALYAGMAVFLAHRV